MATTSKLSFRARNLDATKSMPVYCADELPDLAECTPINRAVAQMPTGMEKDEENESHLQEAILAQQASTSGIAVENHVIPTPKVLAVDRIHYDTVYPVQPTPSINQLIKVQASLSLGNEEPEYDIDSEDEAWLAERSGQIVESDFEKMMELLEGASSGLQICQPGEARSLLKDFSTDLVDDVYDYWLQKRKDAAASRKIASLIPRVKTDARRDASGSDVAYVAFRRRVERMQTRKNRKNDEDSYEKILSLGSNNNSAVILYDMLRRREHTKQVIIEMDKQICKLRWMAQDFGSVFYNQALTKARLDRNATMSPTEESQDELSSPTVSPTKVKGHKRKRHSRNSVSEPEKDFVVTRSWLKRNSELWNRPVTAASILSAGISTPVPSTADAQRDAEAAADGRYAFKRRRGCIYRSSLFSNPPEAPKVNPAERFYRTFVPSTDGVRCIGYTRRRMGRGGRIIFDRLLISSPSTSETGPDQPYCAVIDNTKSYQWKMGAGNCDKDDNDALSDFDEDRSGETDDYEEEYRRREELYARRIFGMFGSGTTQRLPDRDSGGTSGGSGEQVVVLGEDSNGPASGNGQNIISINGVHEADRLRVVNLQQNGPPLDGRGRAVSDCGPQPVLLAASVAGGKVEKVMPLANSPSVNYQPKRVHDHSLRVSSQMPSSGASDEASPVFYAHLPPPLSQTAGMVATGEQQIIHQSVRKSYDYISSSGILNPSQQQQQKQQQQQQQQLIVTAAQQPLTQQQDRLERHVVTVSSQEVIVGGQNIKPRAGGRRRSVGSPNVAQLPTSLPRPETNLQRLSTTYGLNGDIVAQATPCVDTKRLELAIKGSGARIKVNSTPRISRNQACPIVRLPASAVVPARRFARPLPRMSLLSALDNSRRTVSYNVHEGLGQPATVATQPVMQPFSLENRTLRDFLLGTASTGKALSGTTILSTATRTTYTAPQYVPVVSSDSHRYQSYTNVVTTTSYYVPVTDVSSPGSESMSPPTPHAMSPAVQQQNTPARNYFGVTEPKIQTPVAVISSSRPSLNGTQVDTRHGGGAVNSSSKTTGGGSGRATPQAASAEIMQRAAKCRRISTSGSSPLNATVAMPEQQPIEGSGVGNPVAAAVAVAGVTTAVDNIYPQPAVAIAAAPPSAAAVAVAAAAAAAAEEDTLSVNKVVVTKSNHRDIAATCRGMVNYVIN